MKIAKEILRESMNHSKINTDSIFACQRAKKTRNAANTSCEREYTNFLSCFKPFDLVINVFHLTAIIPCGKKVKQFVVPA